MKKILLLLIILLPFSAVSQVRVKGYFRKDGTYVQPHVRSNPDGAKYNNWSTKGNVNPYTGKEGTKDPYYSGYSSASNYSTPSYDYSSANSYNSPSNYSSLDYSSNYSSSIGAQVQEESDWEYVGKSSDGSVKYWFIPRTVVAEESYIKVWTVSSESSKSINGYTKIYYYINCIKKQSFIKSFVDYNKNGNVLNSYSHPYSFISESDWDDVVPGSIMEAVVEDVCRYARNPVRTQPIPRQTIPNPEANLPESYHIEKSRLLGDGWSATIITNGQMNNCYNFIPQKSDIDNYLDIYVGSSTDVAVKIMNLSTGICVRYVYVNSNTSYRVRNIPQGFYYLKIAYGKEWYSKIENGQCTGRFLRSPLYEKGEDILDYNMKYDYLNEQYNVPSYSVKLDVISSNRQNEFETSTITEDEFNK